MLLNFIDLELSQASSALKLLDAEFLNNTLKEMVEIKRDMVILKADIAIHPSLRE